MAYPRFQPSRAFKYQAYTAGTLTFNSASWANWPTVSNFTLKGQTGDVFEAFANLRVENEAVNLFLDAVTYPASTATNSFGQQSAAPTSTTGEGTRGWYCDASTFVRVAGSTFYTIQAGDIASGFIIVQFRYRTASAANRTALASTTLGAIEIGVRNLGPVDPN